MRKISYGNKKTKVLCLVCYVRNWDAKRKWEGIVFGIKDHELE